MGKPGGRKTHSSHKTRKTFKQHRRAQFEGRHVDQVWEDVRKPKEEVHDGKKGPRGTTAGVECDEDLPGMGKYYCVPCSKYFINAAALADHEKTKPHKRTAKRLREMDRPHNKTDAVKAAGMGAPDNGPKLRSMGEEMEG